MRAENFDLQPYLKGDLLELRPLISSDFDTLYAVAADPLIWEQHPHSDRYQRSVFEEFFAKALESQGALIIFDRKTQEVVGSSRFYDFDANLSEVVIGYTFLKRSHWGGAYNRELKKLMLDHAFRFVETALFYVDEKNTRSRRAIEKIGAILLKEVLDPASHRNICVYCICSH